MRIERRTAGKPAASVGYGKSTNLAAGIATEFMEVHHKHWPFEGESEVRPMFEPDGAVVDSPGKEPVDDDHHYRL